MPDQTPVSRIDRTERRLLALATLFLALYAMSISLAPVARARTWEAGLSWAPWLGFAAWTVLVWAAHFQSARRLPGRDPYLLPIGGLLSGWGLMAIWRLYPAFGLRQTIWLGIALGVLILGLRLPSDLSFIRRYKYLWLTSGLILTALTLIFGVNPLGFGPRLWLGCCGIYLQPSEPLKLLLIFYLSAYLADRFASLDVAAALPGASTPLLPLLGPTLLMTGLALALLAYQRDLGTAFIFLFLYATIVFIASGRVRFLALMGAGLLLAGAVGYLLFDVVRLRIEAWVNPWLDPSGRSFQIVQSLLAIANGGLLGRGPGLGSPGLVPVPHSDFIFAAIAEETGLLGALALLLALALLAQRGVEAALRAPDAFRRYLAAGLTAYLVAQGLLIIGGNLRLFPLTGVTLPFVSYGGSSLVTAWLSLLLLMHVSNQAEARPAALVQGRNYLALGGLLLLGATAAALASGWWGVVRGPDLLTRTDNPRRAIADRYVQRGTLLDRQNQPINASLGEPGAYQRQYFYPPLSNVVGYTNATYGQSGLEASLDPFLRGLQGNPGLEIWWNHLLYGQPPPGLDLRLSIDPELQVTADRRLGDHPGALVLLNAETGEVLAMASHPGFDANLLDDDWENLVQDGGKPLLNRATQALYPAGAALGPFLLAEAHSQAAAPVPPASLEYASGDDCALSVTEENWGSTLAAGCPGATAALAEALGGQALLDLFDRLGLYQAPKIRLDAAASQRPATIGDPVATTVGGELAASPLQLARAAAALSNAGALPAPYLASAVRLPETGWALLDAQDEPRQVLPPQAAASTVRQLAFPGKLIWGSPASSAQGKTPVSWYVGGTLPEWNGAPLAVAVVLEQDDPGLAKEIGEEMLQEAMGD